ncbi:hypothetical protein V1520DRAFT_330620 [Lipomyces starkeyi]|uniref:Uncharacterized protein n=1 Tax=Lipomyces starkeyi NRRL Y-11557 TaxID=675824 RepID=A0A1E3PY97_LIPST|nr:hypothetical protein LIPSTDRAFT_75523 [Lipomyces starkeyi NRRL Y-11557]
MTGLQLSDLLAPQLPALQGRQDDEHNTAENGTEIRENLESAVGQAPVSESMTSDTVETAPAKSAKSGVEESRSGPSIPSPSPSPKPDVEMKYASALPSMPIQDTTQLGSMEASSRQDIVEGEEDKTDVEQPILPVSRKRAGEEFNTLMPAGISNIANVLKSGTNAIGKSRESSAEPRRKQQKTTHTTTEEDGDADVRNGTATAESGGVDDKNKPVRGGAPTRRYLNELITPALLDGVKLVAREQPENPLEVLGKYLLERSKTASTKSKSSVRQKSSK